MQYDVLMLLTIVVAWLAVIPLAGSTVARVTTVERVFGWFRAQVELRWKNSLFHYLVNCTICTSYWTTTAISAISWWTLKLPIRLEYLGVWVILTLASIRVAVILAKDGRNPDQSK